MLLHGATTILLFLLLGQMTGRFWLSALVAALFAVHPLHVESVAWIAERKDVLSGLLFMLTLVAYVGYTRHPFSLIRYSAVIVLFALGLMAKPMLVTLPLVLLLLDYWPLGRMTSFGASDPATNRPLAASREGSTSRPSFPRMLLVEKLPLFLLAVTCCVFTVCAQGKAIVAIDMIPFWWRVANAFVSYGAYLEQFFWPAGLAIFYPHVARIYRFRA